jgi:NTP pyrophosphatase (non-canonical NTP hydrolase)
VLQWGPPDNDAALRDELADVLTYAYLLADRLGEDPEQLILSKLTETEQKYPVARARGRSARYDQLPH